jgi:hypothetical protein
LNFGNCASSKLLFSTDTKWFLCPLVHRAHAYISLRCLFWWEFSLQYLRQINFQFFKYSIRNQMRLRQPQLESGQLFNLGKPKLRITKKRFYSHQMMNFSKEKSHSTIPTTILSTRIWFRILYLKNWKLIWRKYWRENSHQNKQRKEIYAWARWTKGQRNHFVSVENKSLDDAQLPKFKNFFPNSFDLEKKIFRKKRRKFLPYFQL